MKKETNKPYANIIGAGDLESTQNAITLIALVITIIILLILAGVTINLLIGDDGLFSITKKAGEDYKEAGAREKLEAVLVELQAEKYTNPKYDEQTYIDNKIAENNMNISGNIVIVDEWQFELDRTVPKIIASLGKGNIESQIQINITKTTASNFEKADIKIEIAYNNSITEIVLNGKNINIPELENGKYTIEQEILENGIYTVIAKDAEGKYNIASITVNDISEDMNIENAQQLLVFRDRVNAGATFKGKTITVINNLDLSSVCGQSIGTWIPIGNNTTSFSGMFEGNKHTIDNLYINSNLYQYVGLFGKTINSTIIQNIILDNIEISNTYDESIHYTGGIAGYNEGTIQNCAIQKGNIVSDSSTKSVYNEIGGIAGFSGTNSTIKNCYNKASIIGKTKILTADAGGSNSYVGGIVGRCDANGVKIVNCYNIGSINAVGTQANAGGIIGATAKTSTKKQTLENLYNIGNTSGSGAHVKKAGIVGLNGWGDGYEASPIVNSYCTNDYSYYYIVTGNKSGVVSESIIQGYAETLGEEYTDDIPNTNGTWKYNNGYPILKWQITK